MHLSLSKFLALFSFCLVLLFSACEDDPVQDAEAGEVEMSIQGRIANQDLAMESVTYDANSAAEGFRLSRISFFLSNVQLVEIVNGQALETELAEVIYFNLGPSGLDSDVFDNIPTGDYTSLRFNFGLTAEQDQTKPEDYATTHPLGQTSEYWTNWGSYIFAKIEGKTDSLPDGNPRFEEPFVFHIGVAAENTQRGEIAIDFPVRGGTNNLSLNLDVAELMRLNQANELPLTSFDHGNRFATQIVSSALAAFSQSE